ncbi:hypothetical protein SERLA73DRAFT_62084 [Serpula lacrymans var. lacrymans S7.3]|uniref:Acyl-CoA oxidase C-alpha1 domain-containing protein n=2 Tax=Serpula lacrymans var. lacrymans TaxID=341189 RepID=F8QAN3_SERL3|nr:uncharacterized protein SERLADRAFT_352212 [Serpula lacrymans var. lacrymans S7.9]EGN94823.1 hypothetical protein SERLA73DRAFT_62084 [Serpula lacrymans var. lacrymans S7.3]EGO20323.1 hypothetical protein SERLADRAFT_352212 [Serpula lacrymans var. lacrymans S7.9]
MVRPTVKLATSQLFQLRSHTVPQERRVSLAYERAKAIARLYDFTAEDVLNLSPKFWQMHMDPILCVDTAATTLLIMQYNLFAGTLAVYAANRPDLQQVLIEALSYQVSCLFCLTEVGHGLDAIHIETTATLLPDGGFELHTPNEQAAKHMPPTAPAGLPTIAIIFARTIFDAEDRGIKPFLVAINDGYAMNRGISCKVIPYRGGYHHINHALTYFDHVYLPQSALLGSDSLPTDRRNAFLEGINRVASGGLAIACIAIPYLQLSSSIAARYSLRRKIVDAVSGKPQPIIALRTQQIPVLTALVQSFVLRALQSAVIREFVNHELDVRIRHGIAAISKVVTIQQTQSMQLMLSDRCGAQGLYCHNQIIELHTSLRGAAIAEGDVLVLSIRLASELLLGRYSMPPSTEPDSLLARHEAGLFKELGQLLTNITHHRSEKFNNLILPQCMPLVEAIGHRMAYDAAVKEGVPSYISNLYIASVVKLDSSWYVQHAGLTRQMQVAMEEAAVSAAYPCLQGMLDQIDVDPYITAPIVSDRQWSEFVDSLDTIGGGNDSGRSSLCSTSTSLDKQNLARL